MTLDRDIRFTPEQITRTADAIKRRVRTLNKSIESALAARAAGATVQDGTLSRHYAERDDLKLVLDNLEVARLQIARQITDHIS